MESVTRLRDFLLPLTHINGMTVHGDTLYMTYETNLAHVNRDTGEITRTVRLPVTDIPGWIQSCTVHNGHLWIGSETTGSRGLFRVDPDTGVILDNRREFYRPMAQASAGSAGLWVIEWYGDLNRVDLQDDTWLRVDTPTGSVPGHEEREVQVTFDGLHAGAPGTYTGSIYVHSNDPDSPGSVVPVNPFAHLIFIGESIWRSRSGYVPNLVEY